MFHGETIDLANDIHRLALKGRSIGQGMSPVNSCHSSVALGEHVLDVNLQIAKLARGLYDARETSTSAHLNAPETLVIAVRLGDGIRQ